MKTSVLAHLAALAFFSIGAAHAAPMTFDFTGVVRNTYGESGTAIGNAVMGSFTYDPDAYVFGGVSYSATTGTFSTSHSSYFHVENGSNDEQFLEDTLPGCIQSGFFFGDPSGTAVNGSSISNLNFDLSAWLYKEVRYGVWADPSSNPIFGWTGTLMNITARNASTPHTVPEPASLMLLGVGLLGFGLLHRRRQGA